MHPNLKGFWRMENTLLDASGNGNNGTVGAGSAAYADGKLGSAWDNDITRYITAGNASMLQITGAITISAWIRPTTLSFGSLQCGVVAKFQASGDQRGYAVTFADDGSVRMDVYADGTIIPVTRAVTAVSLNVWTHISGFFVPGLSVGIYKNGILAQSANTSTTSIHNSSSNLLIGGLGIDGGVPENRRFRGQIDEVQIYNAALDANDIRRVMMGQMPQRRYA
jgi:hypothetical protein